jgi:hypothetical protein
MSCDVNVPWMLCHVSPHFPHFQLLLTGIRDQMTFCRHEASVFLAAAVHPLVTALYGFTNPGSHLT